MVLSWGRCIIYETTSLKTCANHLSDSGAERLGDQLYYQTSMPSPALPVASWETLGILLKLCSASPHLASKTGRYNSTYLIGLFGEMSKMTCAKC